MKQFLFIVIFSLMHAWASARENEDGASALTLDRIVAVVNSEVITSHELDEELGFAVLQLGSQGTPLPDTTVLRRQILERMIMARILAQDADRTGIRVSDGQLNGALDRMAAENKLTREQFRQAMETEGISYEKFRDRIRDEIKLSRLKEREVDNKISISEAEIDSYLRNQESTPDKNHEYLLAHILVLVPEGASPDEIAGKKKTADYALSRLRQGVEFGRVAAETSDAPDALKGGMLEWRTASRLPELFAESATRMHVGEVSAVLKSANGFHLIKLVDKRGENSALIVEQTHAQHILIRLNEIVSETEALQRLSELRKRIAMGAEDFSELARQHSDDASAAKGGDLGWLSPGETVPEFERAMNALKPGELSEPVRSPFGLHLIQVLERRSEDLSEERQRVMARQAIRLRKAETAYQDWIRQQRDKAYVENRLEGG